MKWLGRWKINIPCKKKWKIKSLTQKKMQNFYSKQTKRVFIHITCLSLCFSDLEEWFLAGADIR